MSGQSLPLHAGRFEFIDVQYQKSQAQLRYAVVGESGAEFRREFCETITFPGAPERNELAPEAQRALERALQLLHVFAGVSYFKSTNAPQIAYLPGPMDPALSTLANAVYQQGLAEYAYQNRTRVLARFPTDEAEISAAPALPLQPRVLVAIGGGKDSLVSIEALKKASVSACVCWIGQSELIAATARASGLASLNIQRQVSTELFALNSEGALNGHVPVTAINSAILLVAAVLYGYQGVVFSNEASANAETLMHEGEAVNHQWSKSAAFEQQFANLVRQSVASNIDYFSLLRPYRELAITAKFAKFQQYDAIFSSCNRNFKILGAKPASRWCGQCPKCHFVFLALAPFVPKPRLISIFGRNLLDDLELASNFDALIEWQGAHKPFECVGEAEESLAALIALSARADWQEDALLRRFRREIQPLLAKEVPSLTELCRPLPAANMPAAYADIVEQL